MACLNTCPVSAISSREDSRGFCYPAIDTSVCVECNLCETVCLCAQTTYSREPSQCFAATSTDDIRLCSSSGGVFSALAEVVLAEGGVVFGAAFDDEWKVMHICVDSIQDLSRLRGSKYLQSNVSDSFRMVRDILESGRTVFYTGTGCQILGLNLFLKGRTENLITAEVICHGVPSPAVWTKYLSSISPLGSIASVNFRDKQAGWRNYNFTICDTAGNTVVSEYHRANPFMRAFLRNYILRESCYNCLAKDGRSMADICLGDFWGVMNTDMDDDKGVSAVIIYTDKGQDLFSKSDLRSEEVEYSSILIGNPSLKFPVNKPSDQSKFWDVYRLHSLSEANDSVCPAKPSLIVRGLQKINSFLKAIIHR